MTLFPFSQSGSFHYFYHVITTFSSSQPIQWFSPSGKLIEERSTKNSRVYVELKTEENGVLVPLIIHRIKISDGGNWTCKSGNHSETKEFIVGGMCLVIQLRFTNQRVYSVSIIDNDGGKIHKGTQPFHKYF